MREVNFSIPNVNKASVGITTALYDRRALDCTSTLPLINSLNHLAYLTTSSARIRDILTVDGGIERLVCILKQGRSKDMMGMWKWNLAFQCVVNIGVRGTEGVRTRVVEADMVPVIATILENYTKFIEHCREKADEGGKKNSHEHHTRHRGHKHSSSFGSRSLHPPEHDRPQRRQGQDETAPTPGPSMAAAPQRDDYARFPQLRLQSRSSAILNPGRPGQYANYTPDTQPASGSASASSSRRTVQPLPGALAPSASLSDFLRPVRDMDRLASMAPFGSSDVTSQPTSPTTPIPPPQLRSPTAQPELNASPPSRSRRRPSIRHQNSTTEPDDITADSIPSDESPERDGNENTEEVRSAVDIQDITMEDEAILADASLGGLNTPTASETHQDGGAFNITHRGPMDGTVMNNDTPTPSAPIGLSPNRPTTMPPPQPPMSNATIPRYLERHYPRGPDLIAVVPREEDVLMSLQLLAYVSKYCVLRSYFQKSHLVPKLKIDKALAKAEGNEEEDMDLYSSKDEDEEDQEYLLPNDFNLFPLVEKFTVRYHSTDMQYWAGVVMRNLCRKDDTRGGIRQCAYYQCGKWEEYTRQFAKCRRCRRTKYCSKDCQKSAWAFHRHWCVAASSQ